MALRANENGTGSNRATTRAISRGSWLALALVLASCSGGSSDDEASTDAPSSSSENAATPASVPENESEEETAERVRSEAIAIMDSVAVPFPGLEEVAGEYELSTETEPLVGVVAPCLPNSTSLASIGHRYSNFSFSFDAIVFWPRDGATAHLEHLAAHEIGCMARTGGDTMTELEAVSIDGFDGFRWLIQPEQLSERWTTQVARDGWIVHGSSGQSPEAADELVRAVLDAMG